MSEPVIIEVALNGVTPRARNPHVPLLPEEIAADALACLAAGAAIVHTHIDEFALPGPAAAARYLAGWRPVVAAVPDAILYPTVGFGGDTPARFAHVEPLASVARMGVLDPGSVNLGGADADGLPGGFEFVYQNTFADIRWTVALLERLRLGPSISIFEPGFLRTALAYYRAGRLPAGSFVKLYFGGDAGYLGGTAGAATFGLPPTARALDAYLELLGDSGLPWAVAVIGGDVVGCGMARRALERGGHVRVGLEDYAGARTPANAELVAEVVTLARAVGRPVATPAEAARLLALPARDR
ncbi:MAG TPA: 3-keto-5-aminohexanoate cleavage protein [Candidatus Limnocylindria bacterium]|nr:3-keto-5-aminohexanoate cleavage protein [Candidatus Limnocylindria bacterium]